MTDPGDNVSPPRTPEFTRSMYFTSRKVLATLNGFVSGGDPDSRTA